MDNMPEEKATRTGEERYASHLKSFGNYYITLVCLSGTALAVAIAMAFFTGVLWGVAVGIAVACIYACFSADEAKKQLGLRYENRQGRIIIKRATRSFGDCVVIPSRFIFADVTQIADGAVRVPDGKMKKLYIPVSIERIGKDIFYNGADGVTVYDEGTEEQWGRIQTQTDFSGICILFGCEQPAPKMTVREAEGGNE